MFGYFTFYLPVFLPVYARYRWLGYVLPRSGLGIRRCVPLDLVRWRPRLSRQSVLSFLSCLTEFQTHLERFKVHRALGGWRRFLEREKSFDSGSSADLVFEVLPDSKSEVSQGSLSDGSERVDDSWTDDFTKCPPPLRKRLFKRSVVTSVVPPPVSDPIPTNAQLLYWTLVDDGALPNGYLSHFITLMNSVEAAAARQARVTFLNNPQADLLIHEFHQNWRKVAVLEKTAADVFAQAFALPPRKYKTRLERSLFLRAHSEERCRRVGKVSMDSEIGYVTDGHPYAGWAVIEVESTLRALVRCGRNFLKWLSSAHPKTYPTEVGDLVAYLKIRRDEPCNRGALRNVRKCFEFLEEVTCTLEPQRLTKTEVFYLMTKEILVSAEPGKPTKQAPRTFLCVIVGLENLVVTRQTFPYIRVFLLGGYASSRWGTLRFSDHRGISPSSIVFQGIDFTAVLSHSTTVGKDKHVQSRPVVVHG